MNVDQWYISRRSFFERLPPDVMTSGVGLMSSNDIDMSSSSSLGGELPGGVNSPCRFSTEAGSERVGRSG